MKVGCVGCSRGWGAAFFAWQLDIAQRGLSKIGQGVFCLRLCFPPPACRKLWRCREQLQGLPIMALTATASARVQDDICQQLRLRSPLRLTASFNRPNLHYSGACAAVCLLGMRVHVLSWAGAQGAGYMQACLHLCAFQSLPSDPQLPCSASRPKGRHLNRSQWCAPPAVRYVEQIPNPSGGGVLQDPIIDLLALLKQEQAAGRTGRMPCCIIYTHKRETADAVARQLSGQGVPCETYHAGMADGERSRVLREWSAGEVDVVAATVAFGWVCAVLPLLLAASCMCHFVSA